jgi:tetratricopeptide (TPR) repeat protein
MLCKPALALLFTFGVGLPAAGGQTSPRCEGRACTAADLWSAVNEVHALKNAFVAALRQLAESVSGSYGDEGRLLPAQLDALQRALDSWDNAIAIYEAVARSAADTADAHAALGSIYLDRLRAQDALREFAAAVRLEPRRADIHQLSAMAAALAADPRTALAELEHAHAAAPTDAATLYRLSVALLESDRPSRAVEFQRRVDAERPVAAGRSGNAPAVTFERAGLLRQIDGVSPIFPPQIYGRGFGLIEAGQLAEGVAQLRDAMTNDRLMTSAPSGVAAVAGARLRQGQLQAALSGLRLSAGQSPEGESQRVAGLAYWADEQYDKSIEALTAAAALSPGDERARIALADVFVAANRSDDAERTLREVVALIPDSGQAHYRLGLLLQADSRIADAVHEYEKAVGCAPLTGLDHLFEVLGGLRATQADLAGAVTAHRRRIDVNPNNAEAHRKLGEIYALQGANDAALAEFTVAQWLNPRDADAYAGSGQIYLRLGRFADAARASRGALALDPTHQRARFALGTALARLGDAGGGQGELAVFQQQVDETAARRRRALEAETLASEAARFQTGGDYAQAAVFLQRALDAAPGDARLEFRLSGALSKAGKLEDALAHLTKAQAGEPDNPDVHRLAADIYAGLGRQDERQREEQLSLVLLAQRKEQRLKQRPLLR